MRANGKVWPRQPSCPIHRLKKSPTQINAEAQKQALADSPVGKCIEDLARTPGGKPLLTGQSVMAAADPVNLGAAALTLAAPYLGPELEGALTTRALTTAGTGAVVNAAHEVLNHPNASVGDVTKAGLEGATTAVAAEAVGAGVSKPAPVVLDAAGKTLHAVADAGGKVLDAGGKVLDAAGKDIHGTLKGVVDTFTDPDDPSAPAPVVAGGDMRPSDNGPGTPVLPLR